MMRDDEARRWQHPWLRLEMLVRPIREPRWNADTWPEAKATLGWALGERRRLARAGWFSWTRGCFSALRGPRLPRDVSTFARFRVVYCLAVIRAVVVDRGRDDVRKEAAGRLG